jgi:hypothetical protein
MAPAAAAAGGKGSTLEVLLDHGLSAPKGLSVTSDRNLVIAQGAILGPPPFPPAAPALIYDLRGKGVGTTTPVSDALSKDLKRRGFRFVGSTIVYAFMQSVGLVDDHVAGCFRYGGGS